MNLFDNICEKRFNELSAKYLDENGVNRGLYERDNLKDIIEELADAKNILKKLYMTRLDTNKTKYIQLIDNAESYINLIDIIAGSILTDLMRIDYPDELKKENVTRIGF